VAVVFVGKGGGSESGRHMCSVGGKWIVDCVFVVVDDTCVVVVDTVGFGVTIVVVSNDVVAGAVIMGEIGCDMVIVDEGGTSLCFACSEERVSKQGSRSEFCK
jgi:hypothetical protein